MGGGGYRLWLGVGRTVPARQVVLGLTAVRRLGGCGSFPLPPTRGEGCQGRHAGGSL